MQLFATDALFELTVDSFDVTDPAEAAFSIFGPDFNLDELSGTGATAIGTDEASGLVQFLFENVLGLGAYLPFDGGAVLVEVQASGLLPFRDLFVNNEATLTFTVLDPVDLGEIPLPAGLPLMLAGLGALAVVRRRRSRSQSRLA